MKYKSHTAHSRHRMPLVARLDIPPDHEVHAVALENGFGGLFDHAVQFQDIDLLFAEHTAGVVSNAGDHQPNQHRRQSRAAAEIRHAIDKTDVPA